MADLLRQLDLNLLVVLDVLLDERSVTRAASRLALSQPATSAALGRLRTTLGDRLLIRSRGDMFLTARAEVLRQPVKEALRAIAQALEAREVFDPSELERKFRVTMTDIASFVLGPPLIAMVHAAAPRASLEVVALDRARLHDWLRNGIVDAAVIVAAAEDSNLDLEELFEDELVFLTAPGHRLAGRRDVTAAELVRYPLVEVSFASGLMRPVLDRFQAQGLRWTATLTVPHFLIVPPILQGTDFIGIMGRRAAVRYVENGTAALVDSRERLATIRYRLAWHRRLSHDPAHAWLRSVIRAAV